MSGTVGKGLMMLSEMANPTAQCTTGLVELRSIGEELILFCFLGGTSLWAMPLSVAVRAVPWNLLVYDIPGVLIGGQIGPRLQGHIAPHVLRRAIAVLFVLLGIAMMSVAYQKLAI